MREHAQAGVAQVERVGRQLAASAARAACAVSRCIFGGLPNSTSIGRSIARSARGTARASRRARRPGALRRWRGRRPRTGSARARTAPRTPPTRSGGDAEHVALLRFVAPQLHRRQRRIVARASASRSITPPTPESCSSSGIAFDRPPAPTSCTRQDRIVVAERDAAVDHFLAAALHLRVVALHARRSRGLRRCRPTPPNWRRRRPGRSASPGRRARSPHRPGAERELRDHARGRSRRGRRRA